MDDSRQDRDASFRLLDVDLWSSDEVHRPIIRSRMTIPEFPQFKRLEITDQFEIEHWVRNFLPYSDFNFVSLWCWNTKDTCELSWLNDNLVVLFNDYLSGEQFFSFIGVTDVRRTAELLLDLASRRNIVQELRLIPEITAVAFDDGPGLVLVPTPEHADYVLSTSDWSVLHGKPFRNKRNEIRGFERDHAPECREINLADSHIQSAVNAVYGEWIVQREQAAKTETILESQAIGRVFSLYRPQDLLALGLFVEDRMIGFSINERLKANYSMGHFWKVVGSVPGAYAYMLRHTCRQLAAEGFELHNIQQDLGDPGLAISKKLLRPDRYLGRYLIAREENAKPAPDPIRIELPDRSPDFQISVRYEEPSYVG